MKFPFMLTYRKTSNIIMPGRHVMLAQKEHILISPRCIQYDQIIQMLEALWQRAADAELVLGYVGANKKATEIA